MFAASRWILASLLLALVGCTGEPRTVSTETSALAVGDAEVLELDVDRGDLEIVGDDGLDEIEIVVVLGTHWLSSADDERAIAALDVALEERDGRIHAHVRLDRVPEGYWADVFLRVPARFRVEGVDGSGDALITDLGSLRFEDGSGDVEVARIAGAVELEDGSGELRVEDVGPTTVVDDSGGLRLASVAGDVQIDDGDGDLDVEGVEGTLGIDDGSGELRCVDVDGSVDITDGSGDLRLERLRGSTRVRDGSGDIIAIDVDGLTIVEDESGEVDLR